MSKSVETVVDGQLLMVVEAMKMEHKITAHGDHVVAAVHFAVGDRVDTGDLLVGLAAAHSPPSTGPGSARPDMPNPDQNGAG